MASTSRLLDPEAIAVRAGLEPAFLRLPVPATLFGERAMRLQQLAAGHAMADYLRFAATVCQAQHEAARSPAPVDVPPADTFEQAARAGQPPLPAAGWWQHPAWRDTLRALLRRVAPAVDGPARVSVQRLLDADDPTLDRLAQALLHSHLGPDELAGASFVAAALQVHGARQVAAAAEKHAALRFGAFGRTDDPRRCPCCGGPPTAGVLRLGAETTGLRYLHCAFCAAEWHLVRITCAHCGNAEGLTYEQLQAADADSDTDSDGPPSTATVRAECCPSCHGYLKQIAQDHDPNAEAVADDLASVALDLLLGEAGWQRHGVNPFLLFGDSTDDPPPPR